MDENPEVGLSPKNWSALEDDFRTLLVSASFELAGLAP
jgi:hypothetical protein